MLLVHFTEEKENGLRQIFFFLKVKQNFLVSLSAVQSQQKSFQDIKFSKMEFGVTMKLVEGEPCPETGKTSPNLVYLILDKYKLTLKADVDYNEEIKENNIYSQFTDGLYFSENKGFQ